MRTTTILIATTIALTLIWGVGELHYRNCITAASERATGGTAEDILANLKGDDIAGCSRLPW